MRTLYVSSFSQGETNCHQKFRSNWPHKLDRCSHNLLISSILKLINFLLTLGRRQRDTWSDIRPVNRCTRARLDRRLAARREAQSLLRALTGVGENRAKTARPTCGRTTQSHAASRDTASAGEAISWDFGVCFEIRRIQGELRRSFFTFYLVNPYICFRWKRPRSKTTSATTVGRWVASEWTITINSWSVLSSQIACHCSTHTPHRC